MVQYNNAVFWNLINNNFHQGVCEVSTPFVKSNQPKLWMREEWWVKRDLDDKIFQPSPIWLIIPLVFIALVTFDIFIMSHCYVCVNILTSIICYTILFFCDTRYMKYNDNWNSPTHNNSISLTPARSRFILNFNFSSMILSI